MTTTFARKTLTSLFLKNPLFVSVSRFSLFPYRFSTSSESQQTSTSEFLIKRHHFSPKVATRVSSIYPYLEKPQKADAVLSFLRELGLTNAQLERVVIFLPQIVLSTPANVGSKVKIFHDFGFSASEIAEIILSDPDILRRRVDRISNSLSILKSLLGSNERLSYILRKHKRLFHLNYETTLLPNIKVLNGCGISMEQINALLYTFPHFFTAIKPQRMMELVDKAEKMGLDGNSRMFIYAVRALGSMSDESCKLKFKYFHDLGFTQDDVVRLFRDAPGAFSVSRTKIEKIKELLLETGKYDMSCIIKLPYILQFSVEKRYKPRLQILKRLEKRGLIDKWPGLASLCSMTDDAFFKRFAAPNANEGSMILLGRFNIGDNVETENQSNKRD